MMTRHTSGLKDVRGSKLDLSVPASFKSTYEPTEFEPYTTKLCQHFINEGGVFVDVGVGFGHHALHAAINAPDSHIICFDTAEQTRQILIRNIDVNRLSNVTIKTAVASNQPGDRGDVLSNDTVNIFALDDFLAKQQHIDVIRINAMGHQIKVLKGLRETLKKNRQCRLLIKLSAAHLQGANGATGALVKAVGELGRDIYIVDDRRQQLYRLGQAPGKLKSLMHEDPDCYLLCVPRDASLFIAFVSHWHGNNGGAEKGMLEIQSGLHKRAILTHTVLPMAGPLLSDIQKGIGSVDIKNFPWWANVDFGQINRFLLLREQAVAGLALALERTNPHVIVTNTSVIDVGALAARKIKRPHAWYITEFGLREHGIQNYFLDSRERMRFIGDYSDCVFFPSEALRDYYVAAGVAKKKTTVMYHFNTLSQKTEDIQTAGVFTRKNGFRLLSLGSIQPGKSQLDVVHAVDALVDAGQNVELVIVGSIVSQAYLQEIQATIRTKNLTDHVTILPFSENIKALIKQSDAVVVTAVNEALGRVTMEAMHLRTPVIAAKSGATVELIEDRKSGMLYAPGSYEELAECVRYMIDHERDRALFSQNAFERADRLFSERNFFKRFLANIKVISSGSQVSGKNRRGKKQRGSR